VYTYTRSGSRADGGALASPGRANKMDVNLGRNDIEGEKSMSATRIGTLLSQYGLCARLALVLELWILLETASGNTYLSYIYIQ